LKVKWYYVFIITLLAVEAAIHLSAIGVQKIVIDHVFVRGMYGQLPIVLGLFAAVVILDSVLFTFIRTTMFRNKSRIRYQLIAEWMERFYRIPIKQYRNAKNANNLQVLTKEVEGISGLLGQRLPEGVQTIVKTLLLLIAIGLASPYVLLIVAVLSPVYIGLGNHFGPRLKRVAKEKSELRSMLLGRMEEGVSAAREIAAFNGQIEETKRYHRMFRHIYEKAIEESGLTNKQAVWTGPLKWGANLIVLALLGHGVFRGTISLGTFVIVYQFASQLIDSINGAYGFIVGLSGSFATVERYREAADIEAIDPGRRKLKEAIRSVELESVEFRYGDETPPVLRDLSVSLPIGKKIAFVGASGSGKSTIAQLLVRFYEPTGGRLQVNGAPLDQIDREQWANRTGIVLQEPYLFPDTIRSNIAFGRNVTDEAIADMCRKLLIHDVIMSFPKGYDTDVGERGIILSGGQRQRIAIARSLLANPDILLLDEATSALDAETEREVQQHIDGMRRGRTTIVVAHRLSTVENADILYVLDHGAIVEQGTYGELSVNGPVFKRLLHALEQKEEKAQ
jgi:subfamily B ATP-binding cassette protein MsbA